MELTKKGEIILEARRLFVQGSTLGHSKLKTLEEFSEALDKEASSAQLERIAEKDTGITALLIQLGNATIKKSKSQKGEMTLRGAISRVGVKGCKAALLTYQFEVMLREADQVWRGVFRATVNRSYRAANFARAMATRLGERCDVQLAIMVTVLYGSSMFAKIIAAQSLGLDKTQEILGIVTEPEPEIAELILLGKQVHYNVIDIVVDIGSEEPSTVEAQIAKQSWLKTLDGNGS